MKITNLKKGEPYQLYPSAQLSIERTNPFFNEYGEASVPIDMPCSEHNLRLLDYPHMLGGNKKQQMHDVVIQDGQYYAQCRQYVLSATAKGSISTAFYVNDGSFYSRLKDSRLKDVFKNEFVPGVNSVAQGIDFCRRLRSGTDPHFANFPILVDNDSGLDSGWSHKIINAYGKDKRIVVSLGDKTGEVDTFMPNGAGEGCDFYNAVQRTEHVNNIRITLQPGYYITPFIRANYVLERVFKHFGYTLNENFFSRTEPFRTMVLLNNVIDALVNGKIKMADLVPEVTCLEFLSVFRKKFCCEFVTNEGERTVDIVFLSDMVSARPAADLTAYLTAEPTVQYKAGKEYKRITLASKHTVESDMENSYDSLDKMVSANPTAYFDPRSGTFRKEGFSGSTRYTTKVGEPSQPYNMGGAAEAHAVEVPDCIPEFRTLKLSGKTDDREYHHTLATLLYIGKYDTLNSKMEVSGESQSKSKENSQGANTLHTMLAFAYVSASGKPAGTISAYDLNVWPSRKIFEYGLHYNGRDGIFEKFYRPYDFLLRNSLQTVKAKLLLSQAMKQNLPAVAKVTLRGVPFFFNKLKFTLGGKNDPIESELRTIMPAEPQSSSPTLADMMPRMKSKYGWMPRYDVSEVSKEEFFAAAANRDKRPATFYPPTPSEEWAKKTAASEQLFLDVNFIVQGPRNFKEIMHRVVHYILEKRWLQCIELEKAKEYSEKWDFAFPFMEE